MGCAAPKELQVLLNVSSRAPLGDGCSIPLLGFGTYLLPDGDEAVTAVATALKAGYRHVDTAEGFNNEISVGKAITQSGVPREEIFVTTKVFPGNLAWGVELKTYDTTMAACEASLRKLQTSYVDLYLIQSPSGGEKRLEQWTALVELKRQGKCRSIGVSNFNEAHLKEIAEAGLPMPAANQLELHPLCMRPALCEAMTQHGILPIAYSSLAPSASWRVDKPRHHAKSAAVVASPLASLAARLRVTEQQVLLRWGLEHGFPILPKSIKPERIATNINLYHFQLSRGDVAALDALNTDTPVAWSTGDPMSAP